MLNKENKIYEIGRIRGAGIIRFRRPEIWENKTTEEIKNTFLNILETEGITPFVKNLKGEHSEITEFLENNKNITYKEIESVILNTLKENIDEIAKFIFEKKVKSIIIPVSDKEISVWVHAGMYSWTGKPEDEEKDWYYKYYYRVSITK